MPFRLITLADLGPYEVGLEGKHVPLYLNWSEGQVEPIVEMLKSDDEHEYPDLDSEEWRAFAGMLRTTFTEHQTLGMDVRLSLAKTFYAETPARYRHILETYALIRHTRLLAVRTGWITSTLGNIRQRKQTVIVATQKLIDRCIAAGIDPTEQPGGPTETIILRDADKNPIDYEETERVLRMRAEMKEINAGQATQTWLMDGEVYKPGPARRIFVGSMDRGGRPYHSGLSHQNCKKAIRQTIKFVRQDGEVVDTGEWDAPQLHISMAYELARATMPEGDLYDVGDGFDRKLVKIGTNALFCAVSANVDRAASWSLAEVMAKNNVANPVSTLGRTPITEHDLDDIHVTDSDIYRCLPKAGEYIKAIRRRHPGIAHLFGTDLGAQLQVLDSDAAVRLMLRIKRESGVVPLSNHDSFRVPVDLLPQVEKAAERVYRTVIRKFRSRVEGRLQAPVRTTEASSGSQSEAEGQGESREARGRVHMEVVTTSLPVLVSVRSPSDSTPLLNNSLPPPRQREITPSRGSPPTPAPSHSGPSGDEGCPQDTDDPFSCVERHTPASFMSALVARMDMGPTNTDRGASIPMPV
jgi:hypothetical protein